MKRILFALAFLCAGIGVAPAQTMSGLCIFSINPVTGGYNCQIVTPNNPLPVISSAGISITNSPNVNLSAINGSPISVTNPLPVSMTTAGPFDGMVYNANGVSPTNGQQLPAQSDQWGRQTVDAGSSVNVSYTPTVTASVYAAGNCIGGWNQVQITNLNGQSGFLTGLRTAFVGGSTPTLFAYALASSPTASTCTDKGSFVLGAADIANLIFNPAGNSITLAAPANSGTTTSFGSADFTPPRPFVAGASSGSGLKSIWIAFVTSTAVTPTSVTDMRVHIGAALN